MEEVLNTMRANQSKKNALGKSRAMELQMKSPQLLDSNLLEPRTEDVIHGKGGGEAGLQRVIGSGKGKRGRPRKMQGGSDGVMKDAHALGAKLSQQLSELHGKGFWDDFKEGFMSVVKPAASITKTVAGLIPDARAQGLSSVLGALGAGRKVRKGGAAPVSMPPAGVEVLHARMSHAKDGLAGQALGGQDVPPNGLVPVAYGNAPQAPSSFKRNTVGMGHMAGAGQSRKAREDEKLGMEVAELKKKVSRGGAKKQSERGKLISKVMKEKGLTLGQASKWIKENY